MPAPTPRRTTAASAPSSATRSATASTTREPFSTPAGASPTGGRTRTWQHFQAAADRLTAQYDAYEPLPGSHVNGKLTLSENIADVAGIAAAYDGYRAFNGGKEGPSAQGLTGDQRFFLSFGQIWRSKFRPEALRNSLRTNGHAPGEFRADTVRNVDAWYAAFAIPTTARLYLAPEARVRVW